MSRAPSSSGNPVLVSAKPCLCFRVTSSPSVGCEVSLVPSFLLPPSPFCPGVRASSDTSLPLTVSLTRARPPGPPGPVLLWPVSSGTAPCQDSQNWVCCCPPRCPGTQHVPPASRLGTDGGTAMGDRVEAMPVTGVDGRVQRPTVHRRTDTCDRAPRQVPRRESTGRLQGHRGAPFMGTLALAQMVSRAWRAHGPTPPHQLP